MVVCIHKVIDLCQGNNESEARTMTSDFVQLIQAFLKLSTKQRCSKITENGYALVTKRLEWIRYSSGIMPLIFGSNWTKIQITGSETAQ